MSKVKRLPPRSKIKPADTWDLASLFPDDAAWEQAFREFEKKIAGYEQYRGKLGESAQTLADCLRFDFDCDGARVAWIDAAAAAARHTDWDAWNAGGHFRMRMNELWGVAHARPLGPRRTWMRRQMREEAFAEETGPGHTVTLPPGFAPAVGIPLTFSGGAPEVARNPRQSRRRVCIERLLRRCQPPVLRRLNEGCE